LLADAVDCAKPVNQVNASYADDFVGWEQVLKNRQGFAVVFMVEDWNKHLLVADVEVCVACRQPFIFVADNFGHGQLGNLEFSAILVAGLA
jgi:hypothetical protein